MSGTADWQSDQGALSGDWSVAGHWSTTLVPTAATTVEIGPAIATAAASLVVTATNETAAALLIQTPAFGLGITLALAGSLAVGGLLDVSGGTLLAQGGSLTLGTLAEGGWYLGDALLSAGGGASVAVGGAVSQQIGGTLALSAATLSASVGTLEGLTTLGAGAGAAFGGAVAVGQEATTADPTLVSGSGTLALSGGSTLSAATFDLLAGSLLSLDATSGVAVAGAGFTGGAIAVAAGSTLLAPSGTIDGNVVLAGVLDATVPFRGFADPGSGLTIDGTLSGAGSVALPGDIGTPGRMVIGNAAGFTGSIDLGRGTELTLLSGDLRAAPVQFLGASIDLRGQTYGAAAMPSYDAASGLLVVGASTIDVGFGLSAGQFAATADAFGGTVLRMVSTATWVGSGGSVSGDWANPAAWSGGAVPDGSFTAAIGPGITDSAWTVTATSASAGNLDLAMAAGTLALSGGFTLGGTLAMLGGVLRAAAATLAEGGAASLDGGAQVLLSNAGSWLVGGALDLGTGLLGLTGGSVATLTEVTLAGAATIAVDAASTLLVGAAAPVAGDVAIAAGASLSATGTATLAAGLGDAGLLDAAGSLLVQGSLLGSGTLLVPGRLELAGGAAFTGLVSLGAAGVLQLDQGSTLTGGMLAGGGTVLVESGLTLGSAGLFAGSIDLAPVATLTLPSGGATATQQIGLPVGAAIDLAGQIYAATLTPAYSAASGLLTVGATTLAMGTAYNAASFVLSADGNGGTVVQRATAPVWIAVGGTPGGDWSAATHWNTGLLPGTADGVAIGPYITASAPWTITVLSSETAGSLALGMGASGTFDVTAPLTLAGMLADASGTVVVGPGGSLVASAMSLAPGSGMALAAGAVSLGGAAAADGTLTLRAGATLAASGQSSLAATLAGGGSVLVGGSLALGSANPFVGTVSLAAGAVLTLASGGAAAMAGIALPSGATIDLAGQAYAATLTPAYSAASGVLVVGATTLVMGRGYTPASFVLAGDGHGGTQVQRNPVPSWVASGGALGGDWATAAHWSTGSVPASGAGVAIGPYVSSAAPWTVTVAGTASAGSLALGMGGSGTFDVTGNLALAGTLIDSSGTVALGNAATQATLSAAGVSVEAGGVVAVADGRIDLGGAGTLALAGGAALAVSRSGQILGDIAGVGTVSVQGLAVIDALAGFTGTLDLKGAATIRSGALGGMQVDLGTQSTIDLGGVAFTGQTLSYDPATGAVSVAGLTLQAPTGLSAARFVAQADAAGGLQIATPCYLAGTRILCESGERPVELLRPGDRVVTAGGRLAPVRWVGWTTIDLTRHPAPQHVAPVRIRAEALAPGRPRRDLLVSPDHALLLGGRLVPARLLCNGATIASAPGYRQVSYVHVELDRHDLLLAEGVAAESYLDTGNRALFAGEAGARPLFADLAATPDAAARCAYAARGAARLARRAAALHARLRERAEALGWRLTGDADLRIIADAPGVAATSFGPDGAHVFLPPGATTLRFSSRSFIPDTLDPRAGDGRRLGVALAMRLDRKPLAAACYAGGWHAPQPGEAWRWTDGDARISLPARPREVKITVKLMAAGARYWLAPEGAAAAARNSAA